MPELTNEERDWLSDEITKEALGLWEFIKPEFNNDNWYNSDNINYTKELLMMMKLMNKIRGEE